jgi:hypothetical protein
MSASRHDIERQRFPGVSHKLFSAHDRSLTSTFPSGGKLPVTPSRLESPERACAHWTTLLLLDDRAYQRAVS